MSEEIRALVGARLKEEREHAGLSQAAMGEIAGASRRAVVAWEAGATVPGADELSRLAVAGFDILFVVTGHRTPRAADALAPDEAALVDNYKHADEEGRDAARRVLSSLAKPRQKAA